MLVTKHSPMLETKLLIHWLFIYLGIPMSILGILFNIDTWKATLIFIVGLVILTTKAVYLIIEKEQKRRRTEMELEEKRRHLYKRDPNVTLKNDYMRYSLKMRDFLKGLLMAGILPVLYIIQSSIAEGNMVFNWKEIGMTAVAGFVGYLIKNFFTDDVQVAKNVLTEAKKEGISAAQDMPDFSQPAAPKDSGLKH